jgi:hypothetical protein
MSAMTSSAKRMSAIDRLQSLPAIFRGGDLTVRFQWSSRRASHYLYLWKNRGLVMPLGGHSDVFANLLINPKPDWEAALQMAMPSAVIVGIEALRRAGWTTQVPTRSEVAVDVTGSVFSTERFTVKSRSPEWFRRVRGGLSGDRTMGPPVLSPAWALADLLRESEWGDFGLWPDDIEWDEILATDEESWRSATAAFMCKSVGLLDMRNARIFGTA